MEKFHSIRSSAQRDIVSSIDRRRLNEIWKWESSFGAMEIVRVKIVCVIFCILVWVEKKEVVNFKQQQLVAAETAGSQSGMVFLLKYYSCVTWHESYWDGGNQLDSN